MLTLQISAQYFKVWPVLLSPTTQCRSVKLLLAFLLVGCSSSFMDFRKSIFLYVLQIFFCCGTSMQIVIYFLICNYKEHGRPAKRKPGHLTHNLGQGFGFRIWKTSYISLVYWSIFPKFNTHTIQNVFNQNLFFWIVIYF